MIIDNDDRYIRATIGGTKIMKKFIIKLKLALNQN